jgi:hypothetical protein
MDRSIEEVENKGKILFADRLLSSKAVPYLVKLITELFPGDYTDESLDRMITEKRSRLRKIKPRIPPDGELEET